MASPVAEYVSSSLVAFYGEKGNFVLGNFYLEPVTYQGITFRCAEAAFQAAKCTNPNDRNQFSYLDGDNAFKLGRSLTTVRSDWHQVKRQIMKEILIEKFKASSLQSALISTGNAYIIEHNLRKGRDTFWSDDFDGTGQNELGQILMEIRQYYSGLPIPNQPSEYDTIIRSKPFPSHGISFAPICVRNGCNQPTYNGKPGEYCSKTCMHIGRSQQTPICIRPGCSQPTYNGQPGKHCSRTCMNAQAHSSFKQVPKCARPGCNRDASKAYQVTAAV